MEVVVKRFLARFWDIPASKDHHHCYPWGLALHCLDVGCAEAEKATLWTPMSENGIDEIKQSKYLGMVVLLNFVKGLFHDAHKLYQYDMKGFKDDNCTVIYDPLRHEGNVLDFKLVYPQRTERWGEPFASPGKLNAIEFLSMFPREMVKYTPSWEYLEIIMGLFDMEGSEADIESAKRDLSKLGLATMEQMILDKVEAYFMDKEDTEEKAKPENNVFQVNDDWAAVSARFLMDIRPMAGHVYTKEAVKNYLQREKALSGTAGDYDLPLLYRVKRPNGYEAISKTVAKISFIRIPYLEQACPDLRTRFGRIYFDEKDREAVLKLCPGAENFLLDMGRKVAEQPTAEEAAATAQQPADAAKNAPALDAGAQEKKATTDSQGAEATAPVPDAEPVASEEDFTSEEISPSQADAEQRADPGAPAADVASATEEVPRYEAQTTADTAPESEAGCPEEPGEDQTDAIIQSILKSSSGASTPMQKIIKWENSLQRVINDYRPDYSHPATGWFYVDEDDVYVRTPIFYQKMTNEDLLQHKDWQRIAKNICSGLKEANMLILEPIMDTISFALPGSGTGSTKGSFLKLNLDADEHSNLFGRVLTSRPLD